MAKPEAGRPVPGSRRLHAAVRLRAQRALSERPSQRDLRAARRAHAADSARRDCRRKTGAAKLYEYLKKNNGISMPHSSATDQGTDWRDNDPRSRAAGRDLPGLPQQLRIRGRAASRPRRINPHGAEERLAAAGLLVERAGRRATSWACRPAPTTGRRTFRTPACWPRTSRARGCWTPSASATPTGRPTTSCSISAPAPASATYMMGDSFQSDAAPQLTVHTIGTGAIKQIDVIKNQLDLMASPTWASAPAPDV